MAELQIVDDGFESTTFSGVFESPTLAPLNYVVARNDADPLSILYRVQASRFDIAAKGDRIEQKLLARGAAYVLDATQSVFLWLGAGVTMADRLLALQKADVSSRKTK